MNTEPDPPPPIPPPPGKALTAAAPATAEADHGQVEADAAFAAEAHACPNCGAPVHGPYCHACGQSEKGMVRHLSEVFSDLADIVFNVDSRVFRSLFDLYFRPGFLTTEYIAGRRARYVTPFRLFFVLSLIAFFSMQSLINENLLANVDRVVAVRSTIDDAANVAAVDEAVRQGLAGVEESLAAAGLDVQARKELGEVADEVRDAGRVRKFELARSAIEAAASTAEIERAVDEGIAGLGRGDELAALSVKSRKKVEVWQERLREAGEKRKGILAGAIAPEVAPEPPPQSCGKSNVTLFSFNGKPWHREANPTAIGWLPDAANAKLNDTLQHMCENFDRWFEKPSRALQAIFSVLPQTLFFLMPWFALLLKLFYVFKRRLYMEHLLVALHSHSFLLLSILVILLLGMLKSWAGEIAWITRPLGWLQAFAWLWVFVYLYWMQKRVYRQGWIMTTLKYWMTGISYVVLLSFGAIIAITVSLAVT